MRKTLIALSACLLATAGCDFVTDPEPLEEFGYQQAESGTEVTPGIDVAAFTGEILLVGQLVAPNPCYELNPSFTESGKNLNLTVTARPRQSGCAAAPTGYIWSAAVRHLRADTYELRVTHAFRDNEVAPVVFNRTVTVR
jgi:hypothetical protein